MAGVCFGGVLYKRFSWPRRAGRGVEVAKAFSAGMPLKMCSAYRWRYNQQGTERLFVCHPAMARQVVSVPGAIILPGQGGENTGVVSGKVHEETQVFKLPLSLSSCRLFVVAEISGECFTNFFYYYCTTTSPSRRWRGEVGRIFLGPKSSPWSRKEGLSGLGCDGN